MLESCSRTNYKGFLHNISSAVQKRVTVSLSLFCPSVAI